MSVQTWIVTGYMASSLAGLGCGPSHDDRDDSYPRNCGELGPVDLFDVEGPAEGRWEGAFVVGEHVVLSLLSASQAQIDAVAVDRCGGEPVALGTFPLDETAPWLAAANGHVVQCDRGTGAVDWLDPTGEAPPHRLFDAAWGCRVHAVGGGLAALDQRDDAILWHPSPAHATTTPRLITYSARLGGMEREPSCWDTPEDCPLGLSSVPLLGPETAGDVLLVPTSERALVEVDVRTSSTSAPLAEGVAQMEVLDDPRYVRWIDQEDHGHLLDRRTGTTTSIEHDFLSIVGSVMVTDRWVVYAAHSPSIIPAPAEPWTVLRAYHLDSGRQYEITGRDGWHAVGSLGDDRIVVEIEPLGPEDGQRYILYPASGELRPIDAPGEGAALGDDLLLFETPSGEDFARVRLLSARDHSVETIVDALPHDALITEGARLTYIDRPDRDSAGPLRTRRPDGTWFELDRDVVAILWPSSSFLPVRRSFETREIVYTALVGDHRVVRRTVLP